jgi:hypothetical protein
VKESELPVTDNSFENELRNLIGDFAHIVNPEMSFKNSPVDT